MSETPAWGAAADTVPGSDHGSSPALPDARLRHVPNGEVMLAWEEIGTGAPVLLIHGLGYDRRGWGPAPRILADTFRVVTFDNRGVGDSGAPPGPYSTATMAADALAVLDAARVERVHLVGTSLGGMVAQELALSRPDRIETLVLTATTPGGDEGVPMPQRSADLFAEFGEDPSRTNLRRIVENSLSARTVATRPDLVDEIFDYRLNHPPRLDGWLAQAAAGRTFASLSSLHELAVPTLVIHGTDDNVVDYRNAELLVRAIPGAELVRLVNAGHLCFWERPDEFAKSIRAFVDRQRSGTARL